MTVATRLEHGEFGDLEFDGRRSDEDRDRGIWRLILGSLVVWLILNRAIPDLFVLPVGFALRPSQAVLVGLMFLLVIANVRSPRPWPSGIPALFGMLLLLVVTVAPFIASEGFNAYQSDGAERGLFDFTIYAVLLLSVYQVAQRTGAAILLVKVTVAMTIWQSLLIFYEWLAGAAVVVSWPFWGWFGLTADVVDRTADYRPGALFRPKGTTPHPIVMSSLLAVAILLTVILILDETDNRKRMMLGAGIVPMVLAMMVVDARTGFVILLTGGIAVVALQARRIPRFLPMGLAGMVAFGAATVISPGSARSTLDLFWKAGADNSVTLRTNRLSSLPGLVAENPILGPGWLTNDPRVLLWDNTYSLGLIELGILGMVVYLVFLVSSIVRMVGSRRLVRDDQERTLLFAGIVGGLALLFGGATFDALAFDQFLPTCLLLLGVGLATADRVLRRRRAALRSGEEVDSGAIPNGRGIHVPGHRSQGRVE
jgi:hypothetical protein